MTAQAPIQRNTVRIDCDRSGPMSIPVADVFVALDPERNRAYIIHPCGGAALHWKEIPLRSAERLVALGARAEVDLESETSPSAAECLLRV